MVAVDANPTEQDKQKLQSHSRRSLRAKVQLFALDLVAVISGIAIATVVSKPNHDHPVAALVMAVAFGFWLVRARLYTARFITRRSDEIRRIVDAGILAAATVGVVAYSFKLQPGRAWLALACFISVVALVAERDVVRRRFAAQRRAGNIERRVILVGDNDESRMLQKMFDEEQELGYLVVASLDPVVVAAEGDLTTSVLATARSQEATGAVICASAIDTQANNRLIRDLIEAGIHVELSSTLADIEPSRLTVRPLGRFPVVYVEPVVRHGWRAAAKRSFDLGLSFAGLLVASPLLLGIAITIRRGSPGPILFRQSRIGRNGVSFDVLKFRTMVVDAEEQLDDLLDDNEGAGPLFKMKDDPRVTKLGKTLRKLSLDELPQLWNVVRGEMSLVGPRPALAAEMAGWDSELYGRLRVKPGITGMWQVSGRSEASFEEYTRLDLYYVDNWSLIVDLGILLRTIPAVLNNNGAY